ncbi:MAG: T9SS type A sorting domain-containing protein [Ferruginibacter sp.]
MKKLLFILAASFAINSNAQQLVRATNVEMVTTPGTKIVITGGGGTGGGITFLGTSNWKSNDDSIFLYKTSALPAIEGWLDSTAAGVLDPTSTGSVFFNGSFLQSFYGQTKFHNLFIRNSVGDTLLSSCEVKNILHLDTGFVFTETGYGNDSLLVSNPDVNAIVSSSSTPFSESWVNGRLSRTGNVVGTPAANFYLFPIGKTDSLYAPIKLSKVNGTTATWTAEYTYAQPFNRTNIFSPPLDHISEVEYWEVTSNNQFSTDDDAKISLSWRGQSQVSANAAIRDSLLVAQYINRPPFIWDVPGLWATGNTLGTDSLFGYVNSNSPTNNYNFDERRFTLGTFSEFNALPVKLLYFTAIADGNRVRLNWEAANEQETVKYEIEKSLTATNFTKIGTVLSRQLSQSAYIDFDYSPAMGWNYYRLKMIDKTGNFTYSPVRPVKFEKGLEQVRIFPVPATTVLNIQLPTSYVNKVQLQVFGADGKFISLLRPSSNMVVLNVQPLASATYFLIITKEDGSKETFRFVKQ